MDDIVTAEDHLKVIRSLMERATIYRTISSATAAVGGLTSLAAATYLLTRSIPDPKVYMIVWISVLFVTLAVNTYFISLSAEKRGEPIVSRGLRTTLIGVIPCLATGAFLTIVLFKACGVAWCSSFWMICYGLALISSFHFAPRSVLYLGMAFLFSGWLILLLLYWKFFPTVLPEKIADLFEFPAYSGSLLMAATFGLLHIIYAVATWPRKGGFMASLELHR